MDFVKALKALQRWRWTVMVVAVTSFALVALAPSNDGNIVTQYLSESKILLTPPSGNISARGGQGVVGVDMGQSWFADPTVLTELLQSEELLTRVAEGSGSKLTWNSIREMVQVEPLSQGAQGIKLFKLSVTAADPKESQKVTRLITEEFATYVQELSAREFASTRKFVEELVVEAEQRRMQAEEKLMAVREKYLGAPSDAEVSSKQNGIESQRLTVSQQIPALQAEVEALKAYLDGQTASPPWAVLNTGDTAGANGSLEAQVSENRLKLAQLREIYTEENENVVVAKARLARSEELYQQGLKEYVTSLYNSKTLELQQLVAREQTLSTQLNQLLSSQMSPDDRRALQKLERELTVWEENHLALLQQLYQARVVEQSSRRQGSVNILEQPRPGQPILEQDAVAGSSRAKKMAMAIPFCLILGCAAALLREYLSSSLKLRPRIEETLELPVIAVIPATPSELTIEWERFKRPLGFLPGLGGKPTAPDGDRVISRK
jgi:capsular polysaccharide biosynthesis protein